MTGSLPMSLTSFVGREQELDDLRSLFREGKRLVTLVGIGGIGKTRLALQLSFSADDLGWRVQAWMRNTGFSNTSATVLPGRTGTTLSNFSAN